MTWIMLGIILAMDNEYDHGFNPCLHNIKEDDLVTLAIFFVIAVVESIIQGVIWWLIFK